MLSIDIALSFAGLSLAAGAAAFLTGHQFQFPWDNEPGKDKRFIIGYQPDGTAIYGRLPTGKGGEDLATWATEPRVTLENKLSPEARFALQVASNDVGFERHLFDPYDKTPLGFAKNVGRVVGDYMGLHAPSGELQGLWDFGRGVAGDKSVDLKTAALQAFLPPTGITISKGAPGGPAAGVLYAAQDEHNFKVAEARSSFMQKAKAGDTPGAYKEMRALGIPAALQKYYVKIARTPGARMSAKAVRDMLLYTDPETQAAFHGDQAQARERQATAAP